MAFNSPEYLLFFLFVLAATWAVVGFPRLRIWILLLASYYFYTANNHWLIALILISTQIDFIAARRIEDSNSDRFRRRMLILSLTTNLGLLGIFKYFNFFAFTISRLAGAIGWPLDWVDVHIILPVGISFYTFQSMSYTIDVYRGDIPAERSWYRFAFFVAFFPQLVAGPIVRPSDFLPQLDRKPSVDRAAFESALLMIVVGLVKKIVLADYLGRYADLVFDSPQGVGVWMAALGVYAFTFQIYFDFSGYTDIAIGCSRLLGYELPPNFKRPYAARSITDFWRRWHISLSTWLRDYLYISVGGNRMAKPWGVHRNLMITMLLGGLWHGAAWHFVLWGGLQGGLLVAERLIGVGRDAADGRVLRVRSMLSILFTFHLVCLSWILFRSESNALMIEMFREFAHFGPMPTLTLGILFALCIILGGFVVQLMGERIRFKDYYLALPIPFKAAAYAAAATAVTIGGSAGLPFIYFQF